MKLLYCVASVFLIGCTETNLPKLPYPISNNAVAYHAATQTTYSFTGLKSGKTWTDVVAEAIACDFTTNTCVPIAPLPDQVGRLAATAEILGNDIYVIGGYSVAEDGEEISTPEVWAYDINLDVYERKADMPVPVDDTVSLTYQDRYIYLVSGWHKDGNVVNVQLYDSKSDTWSPATDWPGHPVFGHAGGIVGDVMTICDGVIVVPPTPPATRRNFTDVSACWRGDIDKDDPTKIAWRKLPSLPGKGHYRMAATGWAEKNMIVFAGGSDNPYNFNGIGYDGIPSEPSAHVWGYDISADAYVLFSEKPAATMDHRALIHLQENEFLTLGGMGADQKILDSMDRFKVLQAPK